MPDPKGWPDANHVGIPHDRGQQSPRLIVESVSSWRKSYMWSIVDDVDGRELLRSTEGFRTPSLAWEAGTAVKEGGLNNFNQLPLRQKPGWKLSPMIATIWHRAHS
jgi:hypothetical protein